MSITVAKFRDVAEGTQPGQFMIGEREPVTSLADLDPIYKRLLDEPVTAIVAVTGSDGQPNLTPVWFDYEGDTVLLNLATHRKKVAWLRQVPRATFLLPGVGAQGGRVEALAPALGEHRASVLISASRGIVGADDREAGDGGGQCPGQVASG